MLLTLNKHYLKNFKNFLISQYLLSFKQLSFKNMINISLEFSEKTFFLASFILQTFCIYKYKYTKRLNKIFIILPTFIFFFSFNNFFYPFLLNLTILKKKSKNLISLSFLLNNFFLCPLSCFFYKDLRWLRQKLIILNMKLETFLYKYLQFYFNFLQVPLFKKYNINC